MATAREIITKALQKGKITFKSETPSADELADGLDTLNDLLDSWSNESLLIYARTWETLNLTAGNGEYTIGASGDFNTDRPISVISSYIRNVTTDTNVEIITDVQYNNIGQKDIQGVPYWLNIDNAYPLATIRLYPVPNDGFKLFLLTEKPLTQVAIDDTISLPAGWRRAIIYNLALELVAEYGQNASPELVRVANDALTKIQRSVLRKRKMTSFPNGSQSNIYSGWNS